MTTWPRGCPRVELAPNFDRSSERDRVVLKSRRGERMIFEGAGLCACRRLVQATGRPTLTLISCLVQPLRCNRDPKVHGAVNQQGPGVPMVTINRKRKSSTETVRALTSEAI